MLAQNPDFKESLIQIMSEKFLKDININETDEK
jgi:hypothetical protein